MRSWTPLAPLAGLRGRRSVLDGCAVLGWGVQWDRQDDGRESVSSGSQYRNQGVLLVAARVAGAHEHEHGFLGPCGLAVRESVQPAVDRGFGGQQVFSFSDSTRNARFRSLSIPRSWPQAVLPGGGVRGVVCTRWRQVGLPFRRVVGVGPGSGPWFGPGPGSGALVGAGAGPGPGWGRGRSSARWGRPWVLGRVPCGRVPPGSTGRARGAPAPSGWVVCPLGSSVGPRARPPGGSCGVYRAYAGCACIFWMGRLPAGVVRGSSGASPPGGSYGSTGRVRWVVDVRRRGMDCRSAADRPRRGRRAGSRPWRSGSSWTRVPICGRSGRSFSPAGTSAPCSILRRPTWRGTRPWRS